MIISNHSDISFKNCMLITTFGVFAISAIVASLSFGCPDGIILGHHSMTKNIKGFLLPDPA